MNKEQKTVAVEELKSVFASADIAIITLNKGLTVADSRQLRNKVKVANSSFRVAKNRLAKIAAKGTRFEPLVELLKGPTAIACSNDPVGIAKVLASFSKDNEKLEILGGVMDDNYLDVNAIKQLATLPSLDELRAKIVGLLCAPAVKIVTVLQAPAAQLARVTDAYSKK